MFSMDVICPCVTATNANIIDYRRDFILGTKITPIKYYVTYLNISLLYKNVRHKLPLLITFFIFDNITEIRN